MSKIMVVDDAAFMRMMVKDTLAKGGYTDVCEAGDGAEALEMYQAEKPALVLMDITMPNMDGLEALKAIRGIDSNANVVMCSAMGQESMVIDAIKSGAKDFIVKPFKPERIIDTVEKIVGK
ncbi:two-component system chemotaxis response regulator CheY [Lachnospiraceae bacterium PF1-21]|uniref:Stage 0 sporulation protein A homolog n=1 Tax=Ohessyouella blattaphilus TaxID=2949333 RepID=A0ABT1EEL5_9FIRM|nr:response regulator [Ohessyouella blattaphilus]MCP1109128.1 response regulator [Ohessyouella blattaphilus]MCR8562522.1 response regulator [Ohessyouella blattaphilus]MDL2250230.1 response regulator [Lachnospiraceae bacterium OttesenSCG-928-J05]